MSNEISNNKRLLVNFSYITILQIFILAAPLITYPYLVKVLGSELYGNILTSQVLANYASIVIDFGSNNVCAKHVSIARNNIHKLSEILSSVLFVRLILFMVCLFLYMIIVFIIPSFRNFWILFLLTYGITLNDVLFPQFFFQGLEKMKMITLISIITRVFFILFVFIAIKKSDDYIFVPILYTIGYTLGGIISIYILFKKMKFHFYFPTKDVAMSYVKDCFPIFSTDLICTIKDKVNYILVGIFVGMNEVVIYDLALKLHSLLTKPMGILTTVLLPRFAVTRNLNRLRQVVMVSFMTTLFLVIISNIFLSQISYFFLHENVDLLPLRIFLLAPIFVSIGSVISSNLFVAFGYNRYVFTSILITTSVYIILLLIMIFTHHLNSIYSFVSLAVISYFTELIYRLIKAKKIFNIENGKS